jgi:uncharacterized C2H2 Zn-finger protein
VEVRLYLYCPGLHMYFSPDFCQKWGPFRNYRQKRTCCDKSGGEISGSGGSSVMPVWPHLWKYSHSEYPQMSAQFPCGKCGAVLANKRNLVEHQKRRIFKETNRPKAKEKRLKQAKERARKLDSERKKRKYVAKLLIFVQVVPYTWYKGDPLLSNCFMGGEFWSTFQ